MRGGARVKCSNYKTPETSVTETAAGISDKQLFCIPAIFNVSGWCF